MIFSSLTKVDLSQSCNISVLKLKAELSIWVSACDYHRWRPGSAEPLLQWLGNKRYLKASAVRLQCRRSCFLYLLASVCQV